jgi:hypothetical protein
MKILCEKNKRGLRTREVRTVAKLDYAVRSDEFYYGFRRKSIYKFEHCRIQLKYIRWKSFKRSFPLLYQFISKFIGRRSTN